MSHEWSQGSLQASISTSRGRVVPRGSCAEIEQLRLARPEAVWCPRGRVRRCSTQLAKLSFNHLDGRTADVFLLQSGNVVFDMLLAGNFRSQSSTCPKLNYFDDRR